MSALPICDKHNNAVDQDVNGRIPKACEYITLHGKRDFTDVTIKEW